MIELTLLALGINLIFITLNIYDIKKRLDLIEDRVKFIDSNTRPSPVENLKRIMR